MAYDRLVHDPARGAEMKAHAQRAGVRMTSSVDEMLAGTELVISAVTASETRNAALAACPSIPKGAFYLDINSASPKTKAECGAALEAAGARYVEAAVMTSVPPYGIRVPMLLGGPHAGDLAPRLARAGLQCDAGLGDSGRRFGDQDVPERDHQGDGGDRHRELSLRPQAWRRSGRCWPRSPKRFPASTGRQQGTYFFSRVVQHGRRRAEEMREAAAMVAEAGFAPYMAAATAERQAWVAAWAEGDPAAKSAKEPPPWREVADRMIRAQVDQSASGVTAGSLMQSSAMRSA